MLHLAPNINTACEIQRFIFVVFYLQIYIVCASRQLHRVLSITIGTGTVVIDQRCARATGLGDGSIIRYFLYLWRFLVL